MKALFTWNSQSAKVEDALKEMMICEAKEASKSKGKGKELKKFEESLLDKAELMKLAGKFKDATIPFVLAALLKKIKTDPAFIDEDEDNYDLYNELAKVVKKALESSKQLYVETVFKNVEPEADEVTKDDEAETPAEEPEQTETPKADEPEEKPADNVEDLAKQEEADKKE
jgi:hypothetical protein